MTCPTCHGHHGWWRYRGRRNAPPIYTTHDMMPRRCPPVEWVPCHDCIDGTAHCCDGLREQAE